MNLYQVDETFDMVNTYSLEEEDVLVEDIFEPLSNTHAPYLPDYAIFGYFKHENRYMERSFYLDQGGDSILCITGVPKRTVKKDLTPDVDKKFRFSENILKWVSYWEDNKVGYLFQVISKK